MSSQNSIQFSLYGQKVPIPMAEGGERPRLRAEVVRFAEEETLRRTQTKNFRPIGMPALEFGTFELLRKNRSLWPELPSVEGLRKRAQEVARADFFEPVPLLHLEGLHVDRDPHATSGVYSVSERPTSCYLLNWRWELKRGNLTLADIAMEFEELVKG